ncbi:inorganic phosphate transporter [Actinomycetaceae bacterium WB03_NA08]|uniref:Inorganic phosphate transporter n=1 Tax=Scrofimicrobium canadense TaxID=2652290 RepID=A0A6N7W1U6_9ACTO|nr:inorganic phosphate transporter [Scrofimicrobium canadense]MSS83265.1 inorganic phosphate transporter [Scrofimicrobium canadense]
MDFNVFLVVVVIAIALLFDYTNGFHDAANAIATSVSTRALTPRIALLMAAVMNVIGALLGTEVAKTIGEGIINIEQYSMADDVSVQRVGLIIVLSALVGAVTWNYITWWFGMPSSSSHALIGGLVGAGLASATQVQWWGIMQHVIIPMFLSPVIGFALAFLIMKLIMMAMVNMPYHRTMKRFRYAQTVSAAAMALGHGLQDAQKTMGVIVMALLAGGYGETHNIFDPVTGDMTIPLWVKLAAAGAISLGTYSGGWRIMKTLGRKIIDLDPARGFVAESVSAGVLYIAAFGMHAPISTTQTITAAILGAGATKRWSAVRWNVAGNIVIAWFLTLPMAAGVASLIFFIFHAIIPV